AQSATSVQTKGYIAYTGDPSLLAAGMAAGAAMVLGKSRKPVDLSGTFGAFETKIVVSEREGLPA
ncbi:MAG: hypothetical protein ACOCZE_12975, partial [Planctomycetota bacterium]